MLNRGKTSTLIWLSLLTGALDAIAALLIGHKYPASSIFRFIASGLLGREAFTGGSEMAWWGVFFHFLIAAIWTNVLFRLYPAFNRVVKNKYAVGVIYGILIWIVMNLLVLPLSRVPNSTVHFSAGSIIEGVLPLIICIGIPVALVANNYYRWFKIF